MKFVADCVKVWLETQVLPSSPKRKGDIHRAQYYSHVQENSFIKQCPLHLFVVWVS
jgi:hypothetical protein